MKRLFTYQYVRSHGAHREGERCSLLRILLHQPCTRGTERGHLRPRRLVAYLLVPVPSERHRTLNSRTAELAQTPHSGKLKHYKQCRTTPSPEHIQPKSNMKRAQK